MYPAAVYKQIWFSDYIFLCKIELKILERFLLGRNIIALKQYRLVGYRATHNCQRGIILILITHTRDSLLSVSLKRYNLWRISSKEVFFDIYILLVHASYQLFILFTAFSWKPSMPTKSQACSVVLPLCHAATCQGCKNWRIVQWNI